MEKLFEILAQVDNLTDATLKAFEEALPEAVAELLAELRDLTGRLSPGSTIEERRANRALVDSMRLKLITSLRGGKYAEAVGALIEGTGRILSTYDTYFARVTQAFAPDRTLYRQVVREGVARIENALTGYGMEAELVAPLMETLTAHVGSGTPSARLVEALRERLDPEAAPLKMIRQLAADGLSFSTADYVQTVSQDLDLNHFLYAGTTIATSRPFCQARAGRAFTREEVEGWAGQSWSGAIPGTTAQTIFIYRGGYRCRHQLHPVSPKMYEYLTSRQQ